MGTKKIEIDYVKLVEIYNKEGKLKADEHIQTTYKLSIEYVYQRLVKAGYTYDRTHKKYLSTSATPNFLSLETLLQPTAQPVTPANQVPWLEPTYTTEMDALIMELFKDKLLQLNQFMKINHYSKTVLLNKTALLEEGYKIIEC